MQLRQMVDENCRIFVKSEWNQLDFHWPCFSFSERRIYDHFNDNDVPDQIVLIYVGVSTHQDLIRREYKSAFISAMVISPVKLKPTEKFVSPEIWEKSVINYPGRWNHSLAVRKAANFVNPSFPIAKPIIESCVTNLRQSGDNIAGMVEVTGQHRTNVMNLNVQLFSKNLSLDVQKFMKYVQNDIKNTNSFEARKLKDNAAYLAKSIGFRYLRRNELDNETSSCEFLTFIYERLCRDRINLPKNQNILPQEVTSEQIAQIPNFNAELEEIEQSGIESFNKRKARTIRHQKLVRKFAGFLSRHQYKLCEKSDAYDCYATNEKIKLLIEAKTIEESENDQRKQSQRAIGQIRGYSHFEFSMHDRKSMKLIILFDKKPRMSIIRFISANNINPIWSSDDYGFQVFLNEKIRPLNASLLKSLV